ncbi:MAG: hypothetical protein ABIF77_01625 [bacterium]
MFNSRLSPFPPFAAAIVRSRQLRRLSLGLCLLLLPAVAGANYNPWPEEDVSVVPVGKSAKSYLLLAADQPLTMLLTGPGQLSGFARVHYADGETAAKEGRLIVLGVPDQPATLNLSFQPSSKGLYADSRDGAPSGGQKFSLELTAGEHRVELRGDCVGGSDIFVILYYDGLPQPDSASRMIPVVAALPEQPEQKPPLFTWNKKFGLDSIYDSNFLGHPDDYLAEWRRGDEPEQYAGMNTDDDFILAPSFDMELRRQFVSLGQTRLRAKYTYWRYFSNPIKNNMEFDYYLRQFLSKYRSLELTYIYCPEQYIRHMKDREPYTDSEAPSLYREFRFTKNAFGIAYRDRWHPRVSVKLMYEKNLRYYNQFFIENDMDCWEVRGTLYLKAHKRLNCSFDYSYEYAVARARDTVEETFENADDSDGTYYRDLYRIGLTWTPRFLRPFVNRVDVSGLLMLYWYPTEFRTLFEDPYHFSRKDTVYKLTFSMERTLSKVLSAEVGTRFTERIIDSPWPGDITLDKEYTKYRVWLSLTYKL